MARAVPVEDPPGAAELAEAGDAVLLLVNPALWQVLQAQARHEGVSAGTVLGRAVEQYVSEHGSEEIRAAVRRARAAR